MITDEDYIDLAAMDMETDTLAGILNRNCAARLTVCPECHVDDFTHVEGCSIGQKVDEQIIENS